MLNKLLFLLFNESSVECEKDCIECLMILWHGNMRKSQQGMCNICNNLYSNWKLITKSNLSWKKLHKKYLDVCVILEHDAPLSTR